MGSRMVATTAGVASTHSPHRVCGSTASWWEGRKPMPEFCVDVEYLSRGYMIVEAENMEEARNKAMNFDCESDTVVESDFEDVFLDTLVPND